MNTVTLTGLGAPYWDAQARGALPPERGVVA